MPTPIKVLLADDSEIMRKAIRQRLREDPDIELIAEARSCSEMLDMAKALKPHVIVLDAHIIDTTQVETPPAKTLTAVSRIIAMSAFSDEETKILADRVGASILLDKMDLYYNLIPAIKQLTGSSAA
jgi:DNA-binding NarL/FixJ family response regulator